MSKFKDAFGTPLSEGDLVAYAAHLRSSTELVPYVIVGFTPKMVRLRRVKMRTLEFLQRGDGSYSDRNARWHLCVRIDVKAYLGLAA